MTELWKDVLCFEEIYEVSNLGRILRVAPKVRGQGGNYLRGMRSSDGYIRVRLYRTHGDSKVLFVHRIVATAFLGPPPFDGAEVNHKDGCPWNNSLENLEWVSRSENLTHAIRVLGRIQPRGERHGMSTLNEDSIREMRRRYRAGEASTTELGRMFGVSQASAWRIVRGLAWTHVEG